MHSGVSIGELSMPVSSSIAANRIARRQHIVDINLDMAPFEPRAHVVAHAVDRFDLVVVVLRRPDGDIERPRDLTSI